MYGIREINFSELEFCLILVENLNVNIYINKEDCVEGRKIQKSFEGKKFKVIHCKGAIESFEIAMSHVDPHRRKSFKRGMVMQIQRLADGHRMSKESFPQEGDLPKRNNQSTTKKFNALKRIPIRGYCWLSTVIPNTYFISHYVYKDYDKLKEKDTSIVGKNWTRIEVNGDEC